MQLAGKVVLITGGAKRVGRAIALACAERGADVAITYRTSQREAAQTVAELQGLGVRALAVRADAAKAAQVKAAVRRALAALGRLDVLVNNAAVFFETPFSRLTEADWDRTMDSNLKGPFLFAKAAGEVMLKHKGGVIINLADWAGIRPYRHYLPYCVSKAGIIAMTKALAKELAPSIRVNAVAPGPVAWPDDYSPKLRRAIMKQVPLQRAGSPQDIANTVVFLCEGSDFITGAVVPVDGGRLIA